MRPSSLVALSLLVAAPALAQSTPDAPPPRPAGPARLTTPGLPPENVFEGGGPDLANGGPATTGTLARGATGADNWSNDTAATSNASNPERAIPNLGGGGADGSN